MGFSGQKKNRKRDGGGLVEAQIAVQDWELCTWAWIMSSPVHQATLTTLTMGLPDI
jgi:hypothetical protein